MMKKITTMQQCSTGQRSTVHSRRHLTNFKKFNVSQSVSQCQQSWDSLSNYCQMLNQVFKVSSETCRQFVEYAVKISNIFGFSTFTR